MKRIAFIAHLSELSGSGTSLVATAAAMRSGFETWLILPGYGDLNKRAHEAGLKPVIIANPEKALNGGGVGKKLSLLKARARYVRNLTRFLRENQIDLVCINTSANIFPGIAARLAGVPIVWRIHESLTSKDQRLRFKTLIIRRWSNGFTYDSQSGMDNLPQPTDKPGMVARNFIQVDTLEPIGRERLANPLPAILGNEQTIFTNGTIARKGADILLEAVLLIMQRHPHIKPTINIAGLPPAEENFAAKLHQLMTADELSGRVTFCGLSNSLAAQLAKADLFVSPSRNEALPISIVEAMAAGVPVIATDVGDCADLLEHGRCGWVVPPENPDALAAALEEALTNPVLAKEKAEAAFHKVIALYGTEDFWKPLEEFLNSIIANH